MEKISQIIHFQKINQNGSGGKIILVMGLFTVHFGNSVL